MSQKVFCLLVMAVVSLLFAAFIAYASFHDFGRLVPQAIAQVGIFVVGAVVAVGFIFVRED